MKSRANSARRRFACVCPGAWGLPLLRLDIPDRYAELAPIIVTSPTTRCGTTLVQRLISSSRDAFIYGEEVGLQTRRFGEWLIEVMQHLERNEHSIDADFERALAGTLKEWRPGLAPPAHVVLRASLEVFFQFPSALADHGPRIGRPRWGFKLPALRQDVMQLMLTLMPKAKVVYVVRHPIDALKSAKARRFVVTDEDREEFCAAWAKNFRDTLELFDRERMFLLCYEGLCDKQADYCSVLEAFTGVHGISTREFGNKVNTFRGEAADGCSASQYIAPQSLSDADEACVTAHAGPLLAKFYPDGAAFTGDVGSMAA